MQLVDKPWGKVLLDSAGTERPFMLKSDGQTYAAPDNYPVQLYKNPDGTFSLQEINESGGYQAELPSVVFAVDGKVIRLLDGKGNTTSITRAGDKIRLTDASGRVVELTLVNGTVASLKDHTGQVKITYNYTGGYLTQVTYKDAVYGDSNLKYSWDKGQLRFMMDKNGTPYYLTYDNLNRIASVGEINLLGNPSFEAGYGSNLDSWEEKVDYDYGSITEDSTNATMGKGSVHIQSSPTVYPGSSQSFLYVQQTIPIKPSTAYNLSAQLKTGALNGRAFLNTVQTDVNGTILDSTWKDTRSIALTGTKDWTKQSLSVTTQANAAYLRVYMQADHDSTHFGGDAYFDEAQLVEGAAAAEFHGHTEIGFGGDGWVTSPLGDVTQYVHNNYGNPIAVINDPGGVNSATRMTWNAADQLTSLTTPLGNTYNYKYDAFGNMTKATEPTTDPNGRETSYDYYRNRLKTITQADGKNVQNAWDPVRLDNQTQTDQAGNSKAYTYSAGNLTMESNLLGIADNRIYNSGFNEVDSNSQPLEWARVAPADSINLSEEDPNAPYGGSRVLKLNSGTNHNTYQWTGFISVADKAKGSYILSGDIKATLASGTSSGAVVYIYWYDASQQPTQNPSSNLYIQVNDPNQSDKWNHYTATDIQPPANAVYARIMAITYQGATGYFDNLQFEQSPQIRGYNSLQNSSFVNGLSKWVRSSSYADVISEVGTISLPSTGSSYLESQTLIPVKQGQDYTLSGNLSTDPLTAASGNGASLQVLIYNQAGTYVQTFKSKVIYEKSDLAKYVVPFNSPVNGTAKVRLDVTSAQGVAKFDNIRFGYGREVVTSNYDSSNNYVVNTTNQLNKTVSYGRNDAYGQATSVTSPSGEVIRYAYDGQERLRTVTDNADNLTTYGLDANGNVLSVNTKAPSGTIYNQSSFVYDDKNNLKAEKNAANAIVSSYAYDANGRLTQKTNAGGSTVSLDYDPLGLLKSLKLSDKETYGFSYDLEGRRKQATASKTLTGQTLYTFDYDYDKVGNLISSIEKGTDGAFVGSIKEPSPGGMYSKTDQLLGFNLKYLSNPDVLYAFVYSPNKLVEKVSAAGKDTLFKYDEGSKLKLQTNPNGVEDRFDYNEGNQLIVTSTFKPGNDYNTRISSTYKYDDDGRLIEIKGQGPGSPTAKYVYNAGTEKLNRLTQAEITDAGTQYTLDYSYDPAGNLKSMELPSGQTNTFAYDGDNKISSLNGSASNVSYDANGNLTKLTVNGKTQQYVYDEANRLTSVKNGAGTVIASYTYDGDGQRLTKTVGSETITYHYFNGQLMYETTNQYANKITARYTRTPEGKLLSIYIYRPVGDYYNYYYYHYNAHGDVVAVTDSNGAVYRQYAYDPYGNVISVRDGGPNGGNTVDINNDPGFNNAYTYAGYRYDQETGLYFLNARYYNAGIGRFLTKDTFKGRANDPQSINRYAYAHGNPVSFVDPTGHDVGAPGMDLGVYTEYQKQGLHPTGSYSTPMPAPVSFDQKSGMTQVHSTSDDTKQVINNTLLLINRGATVASIGASTAGIVGVAIGSATLISTAGIIIPVAAIVGVATTLGMMLIGDQVHGTWGNLAISLTGFLSVPILGGASHLIGTELYNAAMATGFAFNIPLSAVTASWN